MTLNDRWYYIIENTETKLSLLINGKVLLFREANNATSVYSRLVKVFPEMLKTAAIKREIVFADDKIIYEDDKEQAEKEIFD